MAQNFKEGNVVELKCGSFPMLVFKINRKGILVIWADEKNKKLLEKLVKPTHLMLSEKIDNTIKVITGMEII